MILNGAHKAFTGDTPREGSRTVTFPSTAHGLQRPAPAWQPVRPQAPWGHAEESAHALPPTPDLDASTTGGFRGQSVKTWVLPRTRGALGRTSARALPERAPSPRRGRGVPGCRDIGTGTEWEGGLVQVSPRWLRTACSCTSGPWKEGQFAFLRLIF